MNPEGDFQYQVSRKLLYYVVQVSSTETELTSLFNITMATRLIWQLFASYMRSIMFFFAVVKGVTESGPSPSPQHQYTVELFIKA